MILGAVALRLAVVLAFLSETPPRPLLMGISAVPSTGVQATTPGTPPRRAKVEIPPDPLIVPYLGTWVRTAVIEAPEGQLQLEHYLIFKWQRGRLRVKTLEYFPDLRRRGWESDWNGEIRMDSLNTLKQIFRSTPDGGLAFNVSGSDLMGPGGNPSAFWWYAGRIQLLEDGQSFRYTTDRGNIPSSTGNLWKPEDYTYKKISASVEVSPGGGRP